MSRTARAWALDGDAFERLLAFLDADRDAAAARYEDIRRRLVKLFAWRGCDDPEGLTDETIDRVARRLSEGVAIASPDPYAYFHGVASNLVRERARVRPTVQAPLDTLPLPAPPSAGDTSGDERRMACLDRCLGELAEAQRTLLVEYHAGDRHIDRRRAIAGRLGIPMNALRIRMHRLRASLEGCIERCCDGRG